MIGSDEFDAVVELSLIDIDQVSKVGNISEGVNVFVAIEKDPEDNRCKSKQYDGDYVIDEIESIGEYSLNHEHGCNEKKQRKKCINDEDHYLIHDFNIILFILD